MKEHNVSSFRERRSTSEAIMHRNSGMHRRQSREQQACTRRSRSRSRRGDDEPQGRRSRSRSAARDSRTSHRGSLSRKEVGREKRVTTEKVYNRNHSRDERESTRRSRSHTRRDDDASRRRQSRSRSPARGSRPSRRRSRSSTSLRSLRERERRLSEERERLRTLEREVRRDRDRLTERERDKARRCTDTPVLNIGTNNHRNRSLTTPTKRCLPNTDSDNSSKQPNSMPLGLLEGILDILKSKAGDRESFASLANVIPDFDPLLKEQTVNVWLDKVDECSEIYNWTDRQTVHYALPKLIGIAKTWYQGLPSIKHSWSEWKVMLRESFPATENYAELLTEMLNRRVRPGESLEIYYFSKVNLLNRCKIFGRQAVDCLLYGIDDRGVRVGAQAAKFDKPEDVLEFFKTIKHNRSINDTYKDSSRDRRVYNDLGNGTLLRNSDVSQPKNNYNAERQVTCFNCNGVGHPSFKCPKPLVKCSVCNYLGHESSKCPKTEDTGNLTKDKNVLEVLTVNPVVTINNKS